MLASADQPGGRNLGSSLGGAILGLLVSVIGAFFVYALWVGFERARETRAWTETRCEIVVSELSEERPTPNSPLAYQAVIAYRYEFGGEARTGSKVKRVDGPTSHRKKAEKLVEDYPVGRELSCCVDPENPEIAILEHNTLAPLYSIWFPGLFVVAGLGIAVNCMRQMAR